ncbi:TRAP transporter small permease [Vogesella sp. LYT5W]|uniref:TRAP transporter small permease protein n=1 Tax=Vogesella margarita TaxID=2984199 RepID=A0ABT5IPB5_9NEIS|nr:TRAP transporter small permease [Vogesella margarita]MDC7714125.1 TRAP transporter small permease [Vogesella margarita]
MHNCLSRIERLVEWLMALALAVMVTLVFGNVVLRYVFDSGIAAAEEVSRLMFVWLVFLGAILALRQNAHLGVEMVQARLPAAWRRGCAVLSHLLMLYALWLFLQGSWNQTLIGLETYSTVLGFPMALFAGAGLLCAVAMLLLIAANLYRIVIRHPQAQIPGSPDTHSNAQDL